MFAGCHRVHTPQPFRVPSLKVDRRLSLLRQKVTQMLKRSGVVCAVVALMASLECEVWVLKFGRTRLELAAGA